MEKVGEKIVNKLKKYLVDNEISQKEFSKMTKVSESTICRIFQYTTPLKYDTFLFFCQTLNIDYCYFLEEGKEILEINPFEEVKKAIILNKSNLTDSDKYKLIKLLIGE